MNDIREYEEKMNQETNQKVLATPGSRRVSGTMASPS